MKKLLLIGVILLVVGCTSRSGSRYERQQLPVSDLMITNVKLLSAPTNINPNIPVRFKYSLSSKILTYSYITDEVLQVGDTMTVKLIKR